MKLYNYNDFLNFIHLEYRYLCLKNIKSNFDLIEYSSSFKIVSEEMQKSRYKTTKIVEILPENS